MTTWSVDRLQGVRSPQHRRASVASLHRGASAVWSLLLLSSVLLLLLVALLQSAVAGGDTTAATVVVQGALASAYALSWLAVWGLEARARGRRFTALELVLPLRAADVARARARLDVRRRLLPVAVLLVGAALSMPASAGRWLVELTAVAAWMIAGDVAFRVVQPDRVQLAPIWRAAVFVGELLPVAAVVVVPAVAPHLAIAGGVVLAALLLFGRVPDAVQDDDADAAALRGPAARAHGWLGAVAPSWAVAIWLPLMAVALCVFGGGQLAFVFMAPILLRAVVVARARFAQRFGHLPIPPWRTFAAVVGPVLVGLAGAMTIALSVGHRADFRETDRVSVRSVSWPAADGAGRYAPQIVVPAAHWRVGGDPAPTVTLADGRALVLPAYRVGWLPLWAYHPFEVPAGASLAVWEEQLARALHAVHGIDRAPAALAAALREGPDHRIEPRDRRRLDRDLGLTADMEPVTLWQGGPPWLLLLVVTGLSLLLWLRDRTPRPVPRRVDPLWMAFVAGMTLLMAAIGSLFVAGLRMPIGDGALLALVLDLVLPGGRLGMLLASLVLLALLTLAAAWLHRRSPADDVPMQAPLCSFRSWSGASAERGDGY